MILELKVKNFFSIKEEQVLSFEATSDNTLEDYYVVKKGQKRVLKMAIIYGPNASGKTNMLKALSFLRNFALKKGVDKSAATGHIPFLLSEKTVTKNGVFNISFYAGDMLYSYSLELNSQYVVKESLHYYPSQKPALVFNRLFDESKKLTVIKIPKAFKLNAASMELLQVSTIPNVSVIAAYSGLNIDFPQLEEAYQFFRKKITDTVYPYSELTQWTSDRVNSLPETKDFAVSFLRNADFNILDIKVNEVEMPTNRIREVITASKLSPEKKEELLQKDSIKVNKIGFSHAVEGGASVDFPMELESAGTSRLYGLSGVLQFVLTNNSCLTIDEIESSLHPDLVIHFINTFLANSNEAQLICTTHDLNILSEQDNFRRDVIWFTEKTVGGATELYSMSDFSHRKNLSFINAYKAGKFGAKPKLGSVFLKNYEEL